MSDWNTRHTLLIRAKNNQDEIAWEEFVSYYRPYLYLVARRMNLNHHDSEEIAQMVLIKLWKKIPEFDYSQQKGRFRGWLCTVTGNAVKNFLQSKTARLKRYEKVKRQEVEYYLDSIILPEIEQIAEREWRSYVSNLAWENIKDSLHENARDSFLLFSEGLAVAEIAERLGIVEGSAYVYKNRVEQRLIKEIKALEDDLG
ncbi:MAG: sigma-70 family RNA polymerase sigma factor [Lentisphaeraceae bacterium]|nr:sigma-70 family RNA polymerase sigma factor [Lentisphaeraceae bacterium]